MLSRFAIHHPTTVLVFGFLIIVAGMMSYKSLPREAAPDIKIPMIMVTTPYESSAPSDIESLITRPLERKLKGIADIKEMTSTSAEGLSTITVEFESDFDIETALQKVRDKVDEAKPDLPEDLETDPMIKEISASDIFPVMFVTISGDVGLVKLKNLAEDLEEDIEEVGGVLDAEILGGLEREIRVEFDQDRVAAYGLTMAEVVQTVTRNNVTTPGGSIDIGDAKYSLKAPGEFGNPAEIDRLVVAVRNNQPIYLSDVAVVRDTFKDRTSFSRLNSQEAVAVRVTKRPGENLLGIANEIKAIVNQYRAKNPPQVKFTVTSDSSEDIEMMVSDLENNMLTGLFLVLIVVFVALGYRNAIMVALAIPFSILLTFAVLDWLNVTLNMIVLFSLILVLGMLVDNAIVIIDNIYRHHVQLEKPRIQAALDAMEELTWPVISSTATTVMAFVPMLMWPGVMGDFMSYLPLTVVIALLASLLVALVINPALGSIFVRRSYRDSKKTDDRSLGPILRTYSRLLSLCLRNRFMTISFFVGLLVALIYMFSHSGLGVEMFPDTDPKRITIFIEAPEGTNIYRTNELAQQAEQMIEHYGNIRYVTSSVGRGGPHKADIVIDMVNREERKASGDDGKIYFANSNDTMHAVRKELVERIVGATVRVDKEAMGPPVGKPINIEIAGDDYATLAAISEQLKARIKDLPGIVDLDDDYHEGLPELRLEVDKERAALLGLDTVLVGQSIKAAVNGIKIGDYNEGEDEYDIVARLPEDQRRTVEDVLRMRIPDRTGQQIPLTSVAKVISSSGLSAITHIDQKRIVTVSSNLAAGYNVQAVLQDVRALASELQMPAGYSLRYTGENEDFEESQAFISRAFLIALLLIYLILVMEFNSLTMPSIIMCTVVLSLIGVFFTLIVTRQPFGVIMTGMGVISLAGVAVNNAIVLIDYTNLLCQKGRSTFNALVEACTVRFRPVILCAVTTVLGLLPTLAGISVDFRKMSLIIGAETTQWWGPMASVIFYGLIICTALTLIVIPCIYSALFDFRHKSLRENEMAVLGDDDDEPSFAVASAIE